MNFEDVKTLSISAGEVMESMGKFMRDLGEVSEHKDITESEARMLEECANDVSQMRWDVLKVSSRILGGIKDDATAIFVELDEVSCP